jgi:hypothetical protein
MEDGSGLAKLIPPLETSGLISRPEDLVCIIIKGLPENPLTDQAMPGTKELTQVEMTNLVNYLQHTFSDPNNPVRVSDISRWSASCQ